MGRAIVQTVLLSMVLNIGFFIVFLPVSMIVGAAGLFSPGVEHSPHARPCALFILADRAVVLHPAWDFCQPAKCVPFDLLQPAGFALHLPDQRLIRADCVRCCQRAELLWRVPPSNTWMKLVGIFGHAFISTMLLSASFAYYRNINAWLQVVLEQIQQKQNMPTQQA
jgi:hypothetical protein